MSISISIKNYSIVIVGNSHNPTVITDYFLKESGIIEDPSKDIDKNNYLITPAVTQLTIRNRTSILVEPNRLLVQSTDAKEPFYIGQKYCDTLRFIKGTAIGINFDVEVDAFDFDKWFVSKLNSKISGLSLKALDYIYNVEEAICNIKITKLTPNKAHFKFNYHHQLGDKPLGEIGFDFEKKSSKYIERLQEIIFAILGYKSV